MVLFLEPFGESRRKLHLSNKHTDSRLRKGIEKYEEVDWSIHVPVLTREVGTPHDKLLGQLWLPRIYALPVHGLPRRELTNRGMLTSVTDFCFAVLISFARKDNFPRSLR